jgi:DNA topoisomerase-1
LLRFINGSSDFSTMKRRSQSVVTHLGKAAGLTVSELQKEKGAAELDHSLEDCAEAAALVYCTDAEPGIARRRTGRGFSYILSDGRQVRDTHTLARIKRLAIPPAWSDVWIAPSPKGHIQATGRDQRGRKQYLYHEEWSRFRDEVKYSSLIDFAKALPHLRTTVDRDLRRHGLPYERVLASIVWLLDNALIRVGNESYARDNASFGLTTLQDRHVEVNGSVLRFAFRGKSGKEWKLKISDRRIARIVKGVQDLPGQQLFQYLNGDGRCSIASQDVNAYIRRAAGQGFSSRHFRTWGGTLAAMRILSETETPDSERAIVKALNGAIDEVAARLGNTRAVCRQCYIHPCIIDAWREKRLAAELTSMRRKLRTCRKGMDADETLLLRWLERTRQSASK